MSSETKQADELLDDKEIHPLALLFPPMTDDELDSITQNIERHGLIDPIILYEGKILDGINRLKGCIRAKKTPRYEQFAENGLTPLQYVLSKNLTRRSLTPGQRAAIALIPLKDVEKDAKARMSSTTRAAAMANLPYPQEPGTAREQVAQMAGVSARYVQNAKKLEDLSPELLEEVKMGRKSLAAAMTLATNATIKPGNAGANSRVRIVFHDQVLTSDIMTKAAAKDVADGLAEKDISVRLITKQPKTDGEAKAPTHMYADTETWNPFVGCSFDCTYCKPSFKKQKKRQLQNCERCYDYEPHRHEDRLEEIPSNVGTVFVCGDADLAFCPAAFFKEILESIKKSIEKRKGKKQQTFYLQSKRPECFKPYLNMLPKNVVLVTTLETNRDKDYDKYSKAPPPSKRFKQFLALDYPRKDVTIEPVMDFDIDIFADWIMQIKPERVWLGYNSKEASVFLPEPPHRKMMELASVLVARGIKVWGKDWRGLDMPAGVKPTQK